MATFIKIKDLKDGQVVQPKLMTIKDEDLHRYKTCGWMKDWALVVEPEKQEVFKAATPTSTQIKEENISAKKEDKIEEPILYSDVHKTLKGKAETTEETQPKKRGRKPKE
jgi:hypothetical protein